GLAYLSKSYLAAIVFGIALTAWLLPLCGLGRREHLRIDLGGLAGLLAATLATVLPWVSFCAIEYPEEFWHEHAQVWKHLYDNVEHWAAPWDRVAFDYLIAIYGVFYTPVIVAVAVLFPAALLAKLQAQRSDAGSARRLASLCLCYAWA